MLGWSGGGNGWMSLCDDAGHDCLIGVAWHDVLCVPLCAREAM